MTAWQGRRLGGRLGRLASIVAGLLAVVAVAAACAVSAENSHPRVVVVLGVPDRALAARALAQVEAARGVHAELRVPRTPTEQLSVTHLFAARRYAIVGVGLDHRIAVAPVARRYPSVRFTSAAARADAIGRAIAASAH